MTVGRVAVEKNLRAFLSLDLPGTKVVIGAGPQEARAQAPLSRRQISRPAGERHSRRASRRGRRLRVSRACTDTFGVVQLEALASGVPVAAFPVTGPKDVIGDNPIGVLERRSARRLHAGAEDFPRGLPRHSRCAIPGRTAPASSSAMSARWRSAAHARCRHAPAHDAETAADANGQHSVPGCNTKGQRMSTTCLHTRPRQGDVTKAYARWAPVYDLVFGAVFERGRQAAIAAAERIGGRILEVGVGTGISLPYYSTRRAASAASIFPNRCCARRRSASPNLGLSNVEGLWVMDAEHLTFPTLRSTWSWRNTSSPRCPIRKPRSTNSPACSSRAARSSWSAASAPKRACGGRSSTGSQPAARKLGWRTEFSFERYAHWAARTAGMQLIERRAMPPFGHFSLIRFGKDGEAAPRATDDRASARRGLTSRIITERRHAACHSKCHCVQFAVTTDSSNRHITDRIACTTEEKHGRLSGSPADCSAGTIIATIITAAINQSLHFVSAMSFLFCLCDDLQGSRRSRRWPAGWWR